MKKPLVFLSCLLLLFTSFFLTGVSAGSGFTDVSISNWFYEDVKYVTNADLMNGTSSTGFSPELPTTRGMIATILWRLEGKPKVETDVFADVGKSSYYSKAVSWAFENEIVNGYDENHFGPNDVATREQLAAIMYRYAGFKGFDTTITELPESFSDKASVSPYALESMKWAYGSGLISGTSDTTLSPRDYTKRCQLAAILKRFCLNFKVENRPADGEQSEEDKTSQSEIAENTGATSRPSGSTATGSGAGGNVSAVPTVSVKDVYAAPGEEVLVPIEIKDNPGVLGMMLTVYYDESLCTLQSAESGEAFRGILDLTPPGFFGNGARFAWDGIEISEEDIKDGEILIMKFKVHESAKSGACPITLKLFDGDALNNELEEIYLRASSGNIVIK